MSPQGASLSVLHIVTLWSEAGEYGGPCTVARNMATELASRGHHVVVAAGTRRTEQTSDVQDGYELVQFPIHTLVPATGFAGVASPAMAVWLVKNHARFDIFHVHLARDLVSMTSARFLLGRRRPVICQPHGMIDRSNRPLATPFDWLLTRATLRRSARLLALTEKEYGDLVQVGAPVTSVEIVPNGVPLRPDSLASSTTTTPRTDSALPIVAFISRLHPRKRPALFALAAERLIADGVNARFLMAGPDEGEAAEVLETLARVENPELLDWVGPLDSTGVSRLLDQSALLVLPSVDEPYPMIVLEAMASGTPVLVTDTCGLAGLVRDADAGAVCTAELTALETTVRDMLRNESRLNEMGRHAAKAVSESRGQVAITSMVEAIYRSSLVDSTNSQR